MVRMFCTYIRMLMKANPYVDHFRDALILLFTCVRNENEKRKDVMKNGGRKKKVSRQKKII